MMVRVIVFFVFMFAGIVHASTPDGRSYPNQPITIIVPASPGGGVDLLARIYAQGMTELLNVPVVIQNVAGASGVIASQKVAASPPDGYTLLFTSAQISINQAFNPNQSFDPVKNFTPIAMLATTPLVLAVRTDLKIDSLKELRAYSEKEPGGLFYSSAGDVINLWGGYFSQHAGINATAVQFKGSGPASMALAAKQTSFSIDTIGPLTPFIQNDKVKLLATTGSQRLKNYPNVPTFAEIGITGMEGGAPRGVFGPVGVPNPIIDKLNEAFKKLSQDPAINKKLEPLSVYSSYMSATEYTKFLNDEMKLYIDTIANLNLKSAN